MHRLVLQNTRFSLKWSVLYVCNKKKYVNQSFWKIFTLEGIFEKILVMSASNTICMWIKSPTLEENVGFQTCPRRLRLGYETAQCPKKRRRKEKNRHDCKFRGAKVFGFFFPSHQYENPSKCLQNRSGRTLGEALIWCWTSLSTAGG